MFRALNRGYGGALDIETTAVAVEQRARPPFRPPMVNSCIASARVAVDHAGGISNPAHAPVAPQNSLVCNVIRNAIALTSQAASRLLRTIVAQSVKGIRSRGHIVGHSGDCKMERLTWVKSPLMPRDIPTVPQRRKPRRCRHHGRSCLRDTVTPVPDLLIPSSRRYGFDKCGPRQKIKRLECRITIRSFASRTVRAS